MERQVAKCIICNAVFDYGKENISTIKSDSGSYEWDIINCPDCGATLIPEKRKIKE